MGKTGKKTIWCKSWNYAKKRGPGPMCQVSIKVNEQNPELFQFPEVLVGDLLRVSRKCQEAYGPNGSCYKTNPEGCIKINPAKKVRPRIRPGA
jgi:hypothetical protein